MNRPIEPPPQIFAEYCDEPRMPDPVEQTPSAIQVLKNDQKNGTLGPYDKIYMLIEAVVAMAERIEKLEGGR